MKNKIIKNKVSIIIRTKNEEDWISKCLRSIENQIYKNFEIIIVDNYSNDSTLKRAKKYKVKILKIKKFLPGKAINLGIRSSNGEYIVCLSAHCIPVNKLWLSNLILNLKGEDIAGVYGRQRPVKYSSYNDKRDLLNTFGLDKKIQIRDSFFHNANSAFKRSIWKKCKFDEKTTNIEDRIWGRDVIKKGYKIIYEPKAEVYHWHGIHQNLNEERSRNVVRILESLGSEFKSRNSSIVLSNNIVALIPSKGTPIKYKKSYLVSKTIKLIKKSKYINKTIVLTDNIKTKKISTKDGAIVPFLRSKKYSSKDIDILTVCKFYLKKIESLSNFPDIFVILQEDYLNRTPELIDEMIEMFINKNLKILLPVIKEERGIWIDNKKDFEMIYDGFKPRALRKTNAFVSLFGLCCIIKPSQIRKFNTSQISFFEIKKQKESLKYNL